MSKQPLYQDPYGLAPKGWGNPRSKMMVWTFGIAIGLLVMLAIIGHAIDDGQRNENAPASGAVPITGSVGLDEPKKQAKPKDIRYDYWARRDGSIAYSAFCQDGKVRENIHFETDLADVLMPAGSKVQVRYLAEGHSYKQEWISYGGHDDISVMLSRPLRTADRSLIQQSDQAITLQFRYQGTTMWHDILTIPPSDDRGVILECGR